MKKALVLLVAIIAAVGSYSAIAGTRAEPTLPAPPGVGADNKGVSTDATVAFADRNGNPIRCGNGQVLRVRASELHGPPALPPQAVRAATRMMRPSCGADNRLHWTDQP